MFVIFCNRLTYINVFVDAVNDHYSGANFGQQEQSDGQNVKGQYR